MCAWMANKADNVSPQLVYHGLRILHIATMADQAMLSMPGPIVGLDMAAKTGMMVKLTQGVDGFIDWVPEGMIGRVLRIQVPIDDDACFYSSKKYSSTLIGLCIQIHLDSSVDL